MARNLPLHTLVWLALVVHLQAAAMAASKKPDTYRGSDDRVVLDTTLSPYTAVGRLNLGGGRQFCTGVLVAPDRVMTAAHCLIDRRTRRPYRPERIHFVAGQRRDTYLDHAPARCVLYLRGAPDGENARIKRFVDDAALVVLTRPLNVKPAPLAAPYFGDPGPLSHPAYSRNRPYLLSVHRACRLQEKIRGVWLTDCDTNYGSSGGPVFVNRDNRLELAAIMSGATRRNGKVSSVALPITLWGGLVDAKACQGDGG
jgi:hypothetical protein